MRKKGYLLQDKGDVKNFLGVHITATDNGKFELTQTGLIKDILHDLNLDHDSAKYDVHSILACEIVHADLNESSFSEN